MLYPQEAPCIDREAWFLPNDVPENDSYDNMDLTARLEDENGIKYDDNLVVHFEP